MALVVTPINYQEIHTCETITGITGPTPAVVSDFYKQGSNCVGFVAKSSGENLMYATGSWNLTGKTIRLWFMTSNLKEIDIYANGGFGIYVYAGTNTAYYYLGGQDTYEGGWVNLCVDPSRTPDSGSAPNLASVTRVGCFQRNVLAGKNQQSTWMDFIHCCDGLSAVDTVTPYTLNDIYLKDLAFAGGWGVLRKIGGVFFTTGSLICDNLSDSGETLVFEDRKINTGLYRLRASSDIQLGIKAGSAGVSGITLKTANINQTPKYAVDATLTAGDVYKLYGSNLADFNTFTPPATATDREIFNCNFSDFGSIVFGDSIFKYCNFISYEAALSLGTSNLEECSFISGVALITYQGGYLLNCSFIAANTAVALLWNQNIDTNGRLNNSLFSSVGTGHAIELGANTPSEITFNGIIFSGYGSDETTNAAVYNNSGKHIDINLSGGSTPTIRNGTGSTTSIIIPEVTLTISAPVSLVGAEIRIYDMETTPPDFGTELSGTESHNLSTYSFASSAGNLIYIQIMLDGYEEFGQQFTMPLTSGSFVALLKKELNE